MRLARLEEDDRSLPGASFNFELPVIKNAIRNKLIFFSTAKLRARTADFKWDRNLARWSILFCLEKIVYFAVWLKEI